jgi:hypothetical protein
MQFTDHLLQRHFLHSRPSIPGYKFWNSLFRALHILSVCGVVGGHIFSQPEAAILPWLYTTIFTGAVLLILNLYQFNYAVFELSNYIIYLKLILLSLIPVFWSVRLELLVFILIISVVFSHMPKHYRHRRFIPAFIQNKLKSLQEL